MAKPPRMNDTVLRVLDAIASAPSGTSYGLLISEATGLPSGRLYPLLLRLEDAGLLTSEWENVDPAAAGRPRRRLYRVTSQGFAAARSAVAKLTPLVGRFA